jgi:hypothetical protein
MRQVAEPIFKYAGTSNGTPIIGLSSLRKVHHSPLCIMVSRDRPTSLAAGGVRHPVYGLQGPPHITAGD